MNSMRIKAEKVIDITIVKESWKRMMAKNMITAAWNIDLNVQIMKDLKLRYLPAYKLLYKIGNFKQTSRSTSSSRIRAMTGKEV
jgi:hypothetical protein